MSRARHDLLGDSNAASSSKSSKSKSSGDSAQKVKLVIALGVLLLAVGLIGWNVLPSLLGPSTPAVTEAEINAPPDTTGTDTSVVVPPSPPRERGAGKRPN